VNSYAFRMLDWYRRHIENQRQTWEHIVGVILNTPPASDEVFEYELSLVQCRSEVDRYTELEGDAYLALDAARTFEDGNTNRIQSGATPEGEPIYMTWPEYAELLARVLIRAEDLSLIEHTMTSE
jgi:hypothetical protein